MEAVSSGGSAAGGCSFRGGCCVGGSGSGSELELDSSSGGTSKWGSVSSRVSASGFGCGGGSFGGPGSLSRGVSSSAGAAGAGGCSGGGSAGLPLAGAAVWGLCEGCGLGVASGAAAVSEMKVSERRRSRARAFIFGDGRWGRWVKGGRCARARLRLVRTRDDSVREGGSDGGGAICTCIRVRVAGYERRYVSSVVMRAWRGGRSGSCVE